jgi:GNAT superfamily N-acetyltransferase
MQTSEAFIDTPTLNNTYRIERFNANRLNEIEYLYASVYGVPPRKDHFRIKYNTDFTGLSFVGFLAYDDTNLPIAFYGVIPCFIADEGRLILAAQSADTMTHPKHRNKGLFVELARLTYELCYQEGIQLVFGFPNQNSLPGFVNKLKWQVTGELQRFTIPIKTLPLERITAKATFLKNLYRSYTRLFVKPGKGIANSLIAEGFAGVYRDDDFLTYKNYNERYVMQIGSAEAWFKIQNGLVIGDLNPAGENIDHIINKLIRLAKKLGVQQIHFQVSIASHLCEILKKHATPVPSFPMAVKDLGSGIRTKHLQFAFADIDIF